MNSRASITTFLRRTFWGIMAVLCVLFSSASKRLIKWKMAPYLTVNETAGKKLKDGSRDRKERFKFVIQSHQKQPGKDISDIHFGFIPSFAGLFPCFNRHVFSESVVEVPSICATGIPLYLRQRRLLL